MDKLSKFRGFFRGMMLMSFAFLSACGGDDSDNNSSQDFGLSENNPFFRTIAEAYEASGGAEGLLGQPVGRITGSGRDARQAYQFGYIAYDSLIPSFRAYEGRGVRGFYYHQSNFQGVPLTRIDRAPNFDWGFDSPYLASENGRPYGVGSENYSVRWQGYLLIPPQYPSGTYEFSVAADDGAEVYLGNLSHPLIDTRSSSAKINLRAGDLHPFRMDFVHYSGQSKIHLYWKKPGGVREEIANMFWYPTDSDFYSPGFASEKAYKGTRLFPIASWLPNFYELSSDKRIYDELGFYWDQAHGAAVARGRLGWKERGINTLMVMNTSIPQELPIAQYARLASRLGLFVWRAPADRQNPKTKAGNIQENLRYMPACSAGNFYSCFDNIDTTLVAWSVVDEPIFHHESAATLVSRANDYRKHSPANPSICNFEGSRLTGPFLSAEMESLHRNYLKGCDWASHDYYIFNTGRAKAFDLVGQPVERLIYLSDRRSPVFSYIEASNQRLATNSRAPTSGEMRAEIWTSIIYGARGINYFPEVPGSAKTTAPIYGTANDGINSNLQREMLFENSRLQDLASLLLQPGLRIDHEDYSLPNSSKNQIAIRQRLPKNFRAAIRYFGRKAYLFILSLNEQTSYFIYPPGKEKFFGLYGVRGPENGEAFAPYELKICDGRVCSSLENFQFNP